MKELSIFEKSLLIFVFSVFIVMIIFVIETTIDLINDYKCSTTNDISYCEGYQDDK